MWRAEIIDNSKKAKWIGSQFLILKLYTSDKTTTTNHDFHSTVLENFLLNVYNIIGIGKFSTINLHFYFTLLELQIISNLNTSFQINQS